VQPVGMDGVEVGEVSELLVDLRDDFSLTAVGGNEDILERHPWMLIGPPSVWAAARSCCYAVPL
jgi:hypothetical protein